MKKIGTDLYVHTDTCNTYAVLGETSAVLVDFGSGDVMNQLRALGPRKLESVLMTHHHRDQGEGLALAVEAGGGIWAPQTEKDLFDRIDDHWQGRELDNSYNNRQDRFSLLEPVPLAGTLRDYARYTFGARSFDVIPSPGHTPGSITLMTEMEGRRVAFCGDLISAPGRLWSLAATQWGYNGAEGVAASVASLLELREQRPDLLLPSHGPAITQPDQAIDRLVRYLCDLLHARGENPSLLEWHKNPFERLTAHLLWNRTSLAYSYVLLSATGKALVIDYGYDFMTGLAAGHDRAARRPTLYTLRHLKRDFSVTKVDVVLPTHCHDDHVAGFNLLREVEGTEVWAADTFAGILERPRTYKLPCSWHDAVPVDRRLATDEPFVWEEYELTMYRQPGHTAHAVAISFEVDHTSVLVIGDQYQDGAEARWNYVYNNGFSLTDYAESAALYRELNPNLILSGHWPPFWPAPGYFDKLDERADLLADLHREIEVTEGRDAPSWQPLYRLEPYQLETGKDAPFELFLTVLNPRADPEIVTARLQLPKGWRSDPSEVRSTTPGNSEVAFAFTVYPQGRAGRRQRVGAKVYLGDSQLEPYAEMVVTVSDGSERQEQGVK